MKCIFPTELGIFESHRHKIPLAVLEATGARMPPLPRRRQIAFLRMLLLVAQKDGNRKETSPGSRENVLRFCSIACVDFINDSE